MSVYLVRSSWVLSGLLIAVSAAAVAKEPADPAWSGFLNGGHGPSSGNLPVHWSSADSIAWQAKLDGYGQSSPVVHGELVFVTSTSGANKDRFHVSALELSTGNKAWQKDFDNPTPQENNSYVSRAAPTPVVDTDGVVALNEGGVLAAIAMDGSIRWQRDLVADHGPIQARHGLASSLEQLESYVFVWIERSPEPYLMAVDKATGETTWKVPGLGSTTWSSPRLIPVGNAQHLVCSASGKIVGFDPKTGSRLWELSDISNNTSCTPIPAGDGQFVIGASDGRGEENAGNGAASNGLVRIAQQRDGSFSAHFVWRAEKASCSFGSPLVTDDRVWIVNRGGVLYQLDLQTGQQLSVERTRAGGTWATPLKSAGKVYLFGQTGSTSVLDAGDGSELATNRLWDIPAEAARGEAALTSHVLYAAAAIPPYLLLRRGDTLFAIKTP